jgi:hypothetical protein
MEQSPQLGGYSEESGVNTLVERNERCHDRRNHQAAPGIARSRKAWEYLGAALIVATKGSFFPILRGTVGDPGSGHAMQTSATD